MDEWLKLDIETPVPIRIEPIPIIKLFRSDLLARIDPDMNGAAFREWLEPMYANISEIMGYSEPQKRCGLDDTCKFGETRIDAPDGTFSCEKKPHLLLWLRNSSSTGYVHIQYSMAGEQLLFQNVRQCDEARYCSINITGQQESVHHLYHTDTEMEIFDVGSESERHAWTTTRSIDVSHQVRFQRIEGAEGYFVTVMLKKSNGSYLYYEKQCSEDLIRPLYASYCVTSFPAASQLSYDVFVLADVPPGSEAHFITEKIPILYIDW